MHPRYHNFLILILELWDLLLALGRLLGCTVSSITHSKPLSINDAVMTSDCKQKEMLLYSFTGLLCIDSLFPLL